MQWIEKAANQNHPIALRNLGVLYKYGIGCELNYNKARSAFEKASKLGNDKATYSLGYLYLKGLGNTKQDYKKAVAYFKKSEYHMAKHWLGVCYLKGYGVAKDIAKAKELLKTNFKAQRALQSSSAVVETNLEKVVNQFETTEETADLKGITAENLDGKWHGKLLQLDWSGKHIEKSIPLELEFKQDRIHGKIQYKWKVNSEEKIGNTSQIDGALYFEDLQLTLPHTSYHT